MKKKIGIYTDPAILWRTFKLDTRMLVTRCHRWVRSCRFEQLKASKALFKSICNHTVRRDDPNLTKICFWFTNQQVVSAWSKNTFFEKIYLKRELCWRALFYPSVQLKIKLGSRSARLFRTWRERTKSSKSTPTPLFLLGPNPPCKWRWVVRQSTRSR